MEDLVKLAIFALLILGPLILKGIGAMGGGGNKQNQRPQPRPGNRPAPGPDRAAQNRPLQAEVEKFLARAKGQPQQQQGPVRQPEPTKARPIRPPQPARVLQAEVIEAEVLDAPLRGPLVQHVEQHMAPRPAAGRSPRLGREVSQADEQLESHLRDTFSHDLSNFKSDDMSMPAISQGTDADVWKTVDPDAPKAPAGASLVHEIVDMFRDPHSVRKAVVLTEILNPPSHRWE